MCRRNDRMTILLCPIIHLINYVYEPRLFLNIALCCADRRRLYPVRRRRPNGGIAGPHLLVRLPATISIYYYTAYKWCIMNILISHKKPNKHTYTESGPAEAAKRSEYDLRFAPVSVFIVWITVRRNGGPGYYIAQICRKLNDNPFQLCIAGKSCPLSDNLINGIAGIPISRNQVGETFSNSNKNYWSPTSITLPGWKVNWFNFMPEIHQ